MRILLYSQFCTPEPIFKSVPFARELIRRGHDARILTGFPNYPEGVVYPGYHQRWRSRETIDGVPILRVPLFASHDSSALRRALNYASFAATSSLPLLCGWKPDVIYIYNLVTLGMVAGLNALLRRVPFVLDVQDIWPESLFESGLGRPWLAAPTNLACAFAYKRAARITVLSPGFKQKLEQRGVPPEKIEVIYNWCDEAALLAETAGPITRATLGLNDWFNIIFAGNMGAVQGLDAVIDAAAILAAEGHRIRFVFMGKGLVLDELKHRAASVAPDHTLFLPARPPQEAAAVLNCADALLIHLQKSPLFEITIPSKTQAYLALGKPILAGVSGDAADLVLRAGAGVAAEPQNAPSLAAAAKRLAQTPTEARHEMGKRGRMFYNQELAMAVGVNRFEKVFRDAASGVACDDRPVPCVAFK